MTDTSKNRRLIIAARVLELFVGVVFAISFMGKVTAVDKFAELIVRYGFPQLSFLAPFIVVVEAFCSICLLLNVYPRIMSVVAGTMLVCFTGAYCYASVYEGITDCGCFGNLAENIPAWLTYLRNALLLIACILIFSFLPKSHTEVSKTQWIVIAALMVAVVYETGHTYRAVSRYKQPHPLYRQPVKETVIGKYVNVDRDSIYCIYVYSYGCVTCTDGLNNIKEYDDVGVADRIIGLPVTEDKDSIVHKAFGITFDEIYVGLGLQGVITDIPVLLYIEDDTIKYVIEGSVPSAYNFRKYYLEN